MLLWVRLMGDKSNQALREFDRFKTEVQAQATLIKEFAMDFVFKDYRRELFGNQNPYWRNDT